MAYIIEVPVDWLRRDEWVWIIEDPDITGMDCDMPFRNKVIGFCECGFFYQHGPTHCVHFVEFSEIGKTVFQTEKEAKRALKARDK